MSEPSDQHEQAHKRICAGCVGSSFLASQIETDGDPAVCSYCSTSAKTFKISELADRVEVAFESHYFRTSENPDAWQERAHHYGESDYEWERAGLPVIEAIEDAAGIPSEAACDVQAVLEGRYFDMELAKMHEEAEFASGSHYEEKRSNGWEWIEDWNRFEKSLKTEARFFSRAASQHLAAVFGDIDKFETRDGSPLVVDAGPGKDLDHLYRARVFQNEERLFEALCFPDTQLGSPPSSLARAGRMNAQGISVFYGATEPHVAVAEVRPVVGSKVAVAKFHIIRKLRLLDLTALDGVQVVGDIFDPSFVKKLERAHFLRSLGARMTRPVMPGDEDMDYLATQACADFLASENVPVLDGIIFNSVQAKDGKNVVLFHNSAQTELLDIPPGTQVAAGSGQSTEDGWEVGYTVMEETPPPSWKPPKQTTLLEPFDGYEPDVMTLRVDPHSVTVHDVQWVDYRCQEYPVDRGRYQAREAEQRSYPANDASKDEF